MPVMIQRQKEAESKAVGSLIKAIFSCCLHACSSCALGQEQLQEWTEHSHTRPFILQPLF